MAEKPITTMAGTVRGGVFSVCVCVYGVWCVPEEELRASRMLRVMSKTRSERISILLDGVSGLHSVACQASIAQRPIRLKGLPRLVLASAGSLAQYLAR